MAKQPESKLVRKIQSLVKQSSGVSFKIHGGDNPFQAVGIPDILCCVNGWFVGIEAKMPGEPLRKMQVVALREIYHSGGIAAIVETSKQAEALLLYIEERRWSDHHQNTAGYRGVLFDRGTISTQWSTPT